MSDPFDLRCRCGTPLDPAAPGEWCEDACRDRYAARSVHRRLRLLLIRWGLDRVMRRTRWPN